MPQFKFTTGATRRSGISTTATNSASTVTTTSSANSTAVSDVKPIETVGNHETTTNKIISGKKRGRTIINDDLDENSTTSMFFSFLLWFIIHNIFHHPILFFFILFVDVPISTNVKIEPPSYLATVDFVDNGDKAVLLALQTFLNQAESSKKYSEDVMVKGLFFVIFYVSFCFVL